VDRVQHYEILAPRRAGDQDDPFLKALSSCVSWWPQSGVHTPRQIILGKAVHTVRRMCDACTTRDHPDDGDRPWAERMVESVFRTAAARARREKR
jgi:hypothetical protein